MFGWDSAMTSNELSRLLTRNRALGPERPAEKLRASHAVTASCLDALAPRAFAR